MASNDEIVIAFLFKRSGKNELKTSEIYLPLSMDLKWFSPNEAKAFVSRALKLSLLNKKGEFVSPNFNYNSIIIPAGFHPPKQPIEEKKEAAKKEQNIVKIIAERIIEKTDLGEKKIIERIDGVCQQKHITRDVAAALVGKEFDVYLDDCFEDIEKTLDKI